MLQLLKSTPASPSTLKLKSFVRITAVNDSFSPSNTVTPQAAPKPSILISGSRTGSTIRVDGTTIDLTGTVTPWVKLPGQTSFTEGSARPTITDNAFTWSRKANKKTYVYITHDDVKSNTITIAAR